MFVALFPEVIHEAGLHPETYFDSSTIILGLVLFGRWLEDRAKGRTTGSIRRLIGLQPQTARLVEAGRERDIRIATIRAGDRLRVRPGDRAPAAPGRARSLDCGSSSTGRAPTRSGALCPDMPRPG